MNSTKKTTSGFAILSAYVFLFLFIASIACSIFSQLPMYWQEDADSNLKYIWIIPAAFSIIHISNYFNVKLRPYYVFYFIFFIYCAVLDNLDLSKKGYFGAEIYNIAISLFILSLSFVFWNNVPEHLKKSFLKTLGITLLVSCLIYIYIVYNDIFAGHDLTGRLYLLKSKNSAAQIILSCIFAGAYLSWPKNIYIKILYLLVIGIGLYMIIIIKSRATIVCLAVVILYFLIITKNKNERKFFSLALIAILIYAFLLTDLGRYAFKSFFLAGREFESLDDLDDLSTGRMGLIEQKLSLTNDHNFLFGVGRNYLDSFPIAIYIQYGVIGCIIIFSFLYYVGKTLFKLNRKNPLNTVTFVLFWTYIVNSLFEAQPPFGPGVKCFFLWMFLGFSLCSIPQKERIS